MLSTFFDDMQGSPIKMTSPQQIQYFSKNGCEYSKMSFWDDGQKIPDYNLPTSFNSPVGAFNLPKSFNNPNVTGKMSVSAGTTLSIPVISNGPWGDTFVKGPGTNDGGRCASEACGVGSFPWELVPLAAGHKCYKGDGAVGYTWLVEANSLNCSFLNKSVCPTFGSVSAGDITTPSRTYDPKTLHQVNCIYDKSAILSSCESTTAYINYERNIKGDPKFFDDDYMSAMCGARADPKSCPTKNSKDVDSSGNVICSNMATCPMCTEWAAGTSTPKNVDKVVSDWCTAHTSPAEPLNPAMNDPLCACISKGISPIVNTLQGGPDPKCWLKGCSDGAAYIPSTDRSTLCDPKTCETLVALAVQKKVSKEDMKAYTKCGSLMPDPQGGTSGTLSNTQKIAIAVGGGTLGLALIIGVVYLLNKKRKLH